MKSRKALMGYAALLILVFHFFPVKGSEAVRFLSKTAYIGVDMFFFLSAYSFGKRGEINFWKFMSARLKKVYLPFVLFCIAAAVYKKWPIVKLLKSVFFVDLYNRGGGAFLWFLPGIMLFYLLVPLLAYCKQKNKLMGFAGGLIGWLLVAILCRYVLKNDAIYILVNRFPIFLIGFYYDAVKSDKLKPVLKALCIIALLTIGYWLLFKFGYKAKLSVPFRDMFYVLATFSVVGTVELFEVLYAIPHFKLHFFELIGLATLEIYGLQMLLGYEIMGKIIMITKNNLLSFFLTSIIVIAMAIIIYLIKSGVVKIVYKVRR